MDNQIKLFFNFYFSFYNFYYFIILRYMFECICNLPFFLKFYHLEDHANFICINGFFFWGGGTQFHQNKIN